MSIHYHCSMCGLPYSSVVHKTYWTRIQKQSWKSLKSNWRCPSWKWILLEYQLNSRWICRNCNSSWILFYLWNRSKNRKRKNSDRVHGSLFYGRSTLFQKNEQYLAWSTKSRWESKISLWIIIVESILLSSLTH